MPLSPRRRVHRRLDRGAAEANAVELFASERATLNLDLASGAGIHCDPRRDGLGDFGGDEVDLYLEWSINDHVVLSPLIGVYAPDTSAADGGSQLGGMDTNI